MYKFLPGVILIVLIIAGLSSNSQQVSNSGAEDIDVLSDQFRSICSTSQSATYLDINNVRALLPGGGSFWWNHDLPGAEYHVPKSGNNNENSQPSLMSRKTIWMGGYDESSVLRLSGQTFRRGNGTGPLDETTGETTAESCENWDRHFTVYGSTIEQHIQLVKEVVIEQGLQIMPVAISEEILGWPARGNPYFEFIHGFTLPDQPLAPFYDHLGNGIYDPGQGDFPIIDIKPCDDASTIDDVLFADQMVFWIYNTSGESETAFALNIEVQVMAYGFATDNPLNDVTFYRYKFLSRQASQLDSFYASVFLPFGMGCPFDDYFGCDVSRSLVYIYDNTTADSGNFPDCGDYIPFPPGETPMAGIQLLSGVSQYEDEDANPLSGFTYYYRSDLAPISSLGDPSSVPAYYNIMTSGWRPGMPNFNGQGDPSLKYVFTDPPNDPDGYSMCALNMPVSNRRGMLNSGPISFEPGGVVTMDLAVLYAGNIEDYPCPDPSPIFNVADFVSEAFNDCFSASWLNVNQRGQIATFSKLEVYPNPVHSNFINIVFPEPGQMRMYDLTGKLIKLQNINIAGTHEIDTGSLPDGVYIVSFSGKSGQNVLYEKVVVF